jgi:hypothetical protein
MAAVPEGAAAISIFHILEKSFPTRATAHRRAWRALLPHMIFEGRLAPVVR